MADRAVSDVIGFALVFGLVVTSVAIVSVSGVSSLENARNAEQLDNAERAFDVLADNVADLHQRGAPSRATEISLGEAQLSTGDPVDVSVSVNETGATSEKYVLNRTTRPVVYSGSQDRKLVYEAGAVFRTNRDGGIVVREPPHVVDDDHVLLPVLSLRADARQSLGGSTVLVRTENRGADVKYVRTNSTVEEVTVRVDSPRANLWAGHYERAGFDCTASGNAITCTFDPGSAIDRVYVVDHDVKVAIDS